MVESATRFALLRTGETGLDANTAECLGYGDGGNGRQCQLQQREKLSKTEVGSPARIRTSRPGSQGPQKAPDVSERTSEMCARSHLRLLDVCFHTSSGHKPSARHSARTKPRTKLKRHVSRN